MFVDLDWPLNASSLLSASAELLVLCVRYCQKVVFCSCFFLLTWWYRPIGVDNEDVCLSIRELVCTAAIVCKNLTSRIITTSWWSARSVWSCWWCWTGRVSCATTTPASTLRYCVSTYVSTLTSTTTQTAGSTICSTRCHFAAYCSPINALTTALMRIQIFTTMTDS